MIYAFRTEHEIGRNSFIKIGYTSNIRSRISDLQTGCPVQITPIFYENGNQDKERAIHDELYEFKSNGEWFRDCRETREYLGYTHVPYNKLTDHGKAPIAVLRFFKSHSANAYLLEDFCNVFRVTPRSLMYDALKSKVFMIQNWSCATLLDQKDYHGPEFEGKKIVIMARENPHELKEESYIDYKLPEYVPTKKKLVIDYNF